MSSLSDAYLGGFLFAVCLSAHSLQSMRCKRSVVKFSDDVENPFHHRESFPSAPPLQRAASSIGVDCSHMFAVSSASSAVRSTTFRPTPTPPPFSSPPKSLPSSSSTTSSPFSSSSSLPQDLRAVPSHFVTSRASRNAQIMPSKVILVRHGQSAGNVNEELYATTPDPDLPLTPLGWREAVACGRALREGRGEEVGLPGGESVHFVVSPYVRAVETFHGVAAAWVDPREFEHVQDADERRELWYGALREKGITWHEDPRVREQDFGNYQDPKGMRGFKRERHLYGPFYYRFPHGESSADVFDRASTFLDSLWRSFEAQKSRNYVIITHGAAIRVLLTRYFRFTVDQYNRLANPRNCEMVVLAHDGEGRLMLQGRAELTHEGEVPGDEEGGPGGGDDAITGYTFYKSLRLNTPDRTPRSRKVGLWGPL